ncbi:peroxide stress protein YaaA [Catalinimonas niigatensis]|uniref:peroxide stress protein YaaA n=1 Tax=Catalinimonas niigatensis TaxID=1397264 RepID=UPI0026663DB0|nr:peroxide stress protein YaaA [Catalinimonas niigatensis]WPP48541.1 peroxide stress protein YaaA [Catalinimonas niigatensis]
MISILSPSKTQDFADDSLDISKIDYTEPLLLQESGVLVKELRKKSVKAIEQLMSVSENIATLNHERFQHFSTPFSPENARQALLAFKGDVYTDIDVHAYKKVDFNFAQKHLCILSGLYGLLKPLDLIQPYRLEMKTKLKNPKGKDLYQFWGGKITGQLNELLKDQKTKVLINLASNEYFKAIKPAELDAEIITPVFKEHKDGEYKTIALYAKRARGMMANFIIRNRIDSPEKLKTFAEAQYEYRETLSSEKEWVFVR